MAQQNGTVLLVEDEETVRLMIEHVLQLNGYHVVAAPSGPAALKLLEQTKTKIDLLLTDIVLPNGMSGRELAEKLQSEIPALKVIFTTGYGSEMRGDLKLEEGVNFIQKPYRTESLLEIVGKALGR